MVRLIFFVSINILIFLTNGCALEPGCWKTPNFAHPGTLEVQRHNMLLSDPFPSEVTPNVSRNGFRPRDLEHSWLDTSAEMTEKRIDLIQN